MYSPREDDRKVAPTQADRYEEDRVLMRLNVQLTVTYEGEFEIDERDESILASYSIMLDSFREENGAIDWEGVREELQDQLIEEAEGDTSFQEFIDTYLDATTFSIVSRFT